MSTKPQKYREGVAYDESEVPADYLPLTSLEAGEPTLRRYISKLCERGDVRRFRCGRRMFVHKDHIESARRRHLDKQAADAASDKPQATIVSDHTEAAVIALCEINNGITLMQATLERLTAAVELIATQPKTAQQELLSTFESNGFHQ